MTEHDPHNDTADRRHFFRIDDTIRLDLVRVPDEELAGRLDRLEQGLAGNFTVMSSLAAITARMTVTFRRLENRDPDLAAYLRAVDQKIEVIGRAFTAQASSLVEEQAVPVNLSAGGMCVGVREEYAVGSHVEVRMLLFPSFTGLLIYGTVVDFSEPPTPGDSAFSHLARIEFTHIREQDRELLIRHLLRRQGDQLRDQRSTD
jgi:hypothetical protein